MVLDKNDLGNDGIRELANGLIDRFNAMDRDSSNVYFTVDLTTNIMSNYIQMPIQSLSIAQTAFTDYGFKFLLQRMETIYIRQVQTNREIESGMHLDISDNRLSDASIRFFSELLGKFSGFRSINMSNVNQVMQLNNTGYLELAKALRENTSLIELDLRYNGITDD